MREKWESSHIARALYLTLFETKEGYLDRRKAISSGWIKKEKERKKRYKTRTREGWRNYYDTGIVFACGKRRWCTRQLSSKHSLVNNAWESCYVEKATFPPRTRHRYAFFLLRIPVRRVRCDVFHARVARLHARRAGEVIPEDTRWSLIGRSTSPSQARLHSAELYTRHRQNSRLALVRSHLSR